MNKTGGDAPIRRFILIEELDKVEKGKLSHNISYGLESTGDSSLTHWNGSIISPSGRIYFLHLTCGPNYPNTSPVVQFRSKINLPSVNQSTGAVDLGKIAGIKVWNVKMRIETILQEILNDIIKNKNLPQPAEGSDF